VGERLGVSVKGHWLGRAFHDRAEAVVEERMAEVEMCQIPQIRRLSGNLNHEMAIWDSPLGRFKQNGERSVCCCKTNGFCGMTRGSALP
jgi:hypothetical protein